MNSTKRRLTDKVLLSIDWDFFFPIPEHDPHMLYDWGHSEDRNIFYGIVWTIRAADLLRRTGELPGTSGEEKSFWNRFKFNEHATLFYSESHKDMLHPLVRPYTKNILNFDAHHDAGYSYPIEQSVVGCDNWAELLIKKGSNIQVVYPAWKSCAFECEPTSQVEIERVIDDDKDYEQVFDAVFVCRSGAWVPSWLDKDFDDFIKNCPLTKRVQVGQFIKRKWNEDTAREAANIMEQAYEIGSKKGGN